jgi:ClpP class serine protease
VNVPVIGILTKSGWLGPSSAELADTVRRLDADDSVKQIVLLVDSPGGEIAGALDFASAVKAASAKTTAYIDDISCGVAYVIASQASRVYANTAAFIGGVGCEVVIHDSSAAAKRAGVKTHVIRAGEHKGVGTPGAAVTDKHLAGLQALVNDQAALLWQAVAKARPRVNVAELKTARVHIAGAAQGYAMIDGIVDFESVADSDQISTQRQTGALPLSATAVVPGKYRQVRHSPQRRSK